MKITKFEPGKIFYIETPLPLAVMFFEHDMEKDNETIKLTYHLRFTEPLAFLFRRLIGTPIANGFPTVMSNIIEHSRNMQMTDL